MGGTVLVTGGTGLLGRLVVRRLVEAGRQVRVMSRRAHPAGDRPYEWATADLDSGQGVDEAVAGTWPGTPPGIRPAAPEPSGAAVIVHCATTFRRDKEIRAAGRLAEAAARAGRPHLVYISIVGIDRVPLGYYRGKLEAERLIERSGLPYTILRATQFHDLIRALLAAAVKAPVMAVPNLRFQPVDAGEVAARLTELALGGPAGRAEDMGGPEVAHARDLARTYLRATGRRRAILPARLPGAVFHGYRQGGHLTPEHATGRITFAQYLAARPDSRRVSYREPLS